ncbi:MAG TPA: trehalase family glycosidase, partial [Polyangiaceae bacterium]
YWALLARAVPHERLSRFVSHLDASSEFRRVHRVPSLSADTQGYDPDGGHWLGGVWAPTNYMVLRGLTEHGQDDLAHAIADNHYSNVIASYEKTGAIWEHHAPDTPGAGRGRTDFCGWTGITPIAILFEYVIGLRADPVAGVLVWDVRRLDEHGVDRYPFGSDGMLDLRCAARSSATERPRLSIKSNVAFTLDLVWGGGRERVPVTPT